MGQYSWQKTLWKDYGELCQSLEGGRYINHGHQDGHDQRNEGFRLAAWTFILLYGW